MLHVLSHWAHVVVLVLIVVHVRLEEWIFQELALHLLVEHVVFHIWSHAVGKHELVVLLAAISRVCYDFAAVEAELVTEGLQKGDERAVVSGPPVQVIIDNILVFSRYLDIITWLGLAIVHGVLLHVHERGIRIGLAVAVPLSEYLKMFVILIQFRKALFLHLGYGLAKLPVRNTFLVHLLKDTVRALLKVFLGDLLWLFGGILLGKCLFGFLQDTIHLGQQFLLVLLYGAFPDKGVLVRDGFYLGAVYVLHVQRYEALVMKQLIVLKSGRFIPLNHMKNTFSSNRDAMRRPE